MTYITDVCDFQGGTQPPKSSWSKTSQKGYVRMLQIRDFTQQKDVYIEYVRDTGTLKKCSEDDILIGRYGASIGKILTGLSGAYNVAIVKTVPDQTKISKEFLYYLLKGDKFQTFIKNIGSRAAQAGFNKTELRKFEFYLPSLNEQKQLVQKLNLVNSLHPKRKQSIELLDEYINAVFVDMFGDIEQNPFKWEISTLEKITKKVTDGTHQSPKFIEKGIPFIFISNIIDNEISLDTKKFISEETYRELTRTTPIERYDILYTTVGSYGNPTIVKTMEKFCFQRHIAHIKPDHEKTNVFFLYGMLNSPYIKRQADKEARGIAQKTLNLSELKKFKVILPPIELQNKFAKIVKDTEQLKQTMIKQAMELDNQFQVVMQKSFSNN